MGGELQGDVHVALRVDGHTAELAVSWPAACRRRHFFFDFVGQSADLFADAARTNLPTVYEAAERLAEDLGLPDDWANDAVMAARAVTLISYKVSWDQRS